MKKILLVLVLLFVPVIYQANQNVNNVSGKVAFTSDYIFRGVSQTNSNPAIQGGMDWNAPLGITAGFWGSSLNYATAREHLEVDFFGGYTHSFNDNDNIKAYLGVSHYTYFNNRTLNNIEIPLKFKYENMNISYAISPDWRNTSSVAGYASIGTGYPITSGIVLSTNIGYSHFDAKTKNINYFDVKAGLSKSIYDVLVDISATAVGNGNNDASNDPKAVLTLSKTL